jgi:hypothetical protein
MATKIDWITGTRKLYGKSPKEYYSELLEKLVTDLKRKSSIISCPKCHSKNRGFNKFCQKCGVELKIKYQKSKTRKHFMEYNQSKDLKDLDEEDQDAAVDTLNKEFKL